MAQAVVYGGRRVEVNDSAVEILALKIRLGLQVECGNNVQEKLRFVRCMLGDSPSPAVVAALMKVRKELEEQA